MVLSSFLNRSSVAFVHSSTYTSSFAAQSFHQSHSGGTSLAAMLFRSLAYWLTASSLALVGAIPASLIERQDGACTNTPRTRQCWSDGYSISTDFDAKAPPAGTTVTVRSSIIYLTYTLTTASIILRFQMSPDRTRMERLVSGSFN
jgi:hypothetical protein